MTTDRTHDPRWGDPTTMRCYLCRPDRLRRVLKVRDPHPRAADPTESYLLSCGHEVI